MFNFLGTPKVSYFANYLLLNRDLFVGFLVDLTPDFS